MKINKKTILLCICTLILTTGCGKEVQIGKSGDTKDEILSFYNERYFDSYMEKVNQDCLKEYLTKEEISESEEELNTAMEELETAYGDELEAAINYYTGETLDGYKTMYLNDLLQEKAALKYCENNEVDTDKCNEYITLYGYYAIREAREKANLKFKDEEMNKAYESYISTEDKSIKELEDEMNRVGKENIVDMTYEELTTKLANKESFIMVVTQTTCTYCKTFAPIINKVAGDKEIKVYELDLKKLTAKESEEFEKKFTVEGTPTTFFIKAGKTQTKMTQDGVVEEEELTKLFDQFLN